MSDYLPTFFALALCLMLSFLMSGMEMGVFALNRLRIRRLARMGNPQAQVLHGFLEQPEKFLWTVLVGNTVVNFFILGWVIAQMHEYFEGRPALVIPLLAVIVFLFYVFFDLLPKMLFRTYPNRLCLSSAKVFQLASVALLPVVSVVQGVSWLVLRWTGGRVFTKRLFGNREEMRAVMAEAAQALTSEEHAMVNRVLDLQHFTVAEITMPMAKIFLVKGAAPLREALALAKGKNIFRLPVWESRDGKNRIAGLLEVNQLLYCEALDMDKPAAEFMSPALFFGEGMRLEIALRRLQRAGQRLAIVLARDGTEAGVVTLEDILKLMFGEVKL